MNIVISKHARERIKTYNLTEKLVKETVEKPDEIVEGYENTKIAHKLLKDHILRVVYTKEKNNIKIVTVYPAKKERYFKK